MRRLLLSPRWLVRTVFALAWVGTCLRLGWWQWDRAQVTSSPQNLGYALQWPLFALFAAFAWWRMLQLELRAPAAGPVAESSPAAAPSPGFPGSGELGSGEVGSAEPGPGEVGSTEPRSGELARDHEPDDELAAYNRYLRALHLQDQQRGR